MKFTEMSSTKKGSVGEAIIRRHLEQRGGIVYAPVTDRAHLVDFFNVDPKGNLRAIEVKTYPRLYTRPATGIDTPDLHSYCRLIDDHGMNVLLYFVDEIEQAIYAGAISKLRYYDDTMAGKTLFPLAALHLVRRLTRRELIRIRKDSAIDYALYQGTRLYFDGEGGATL